MKVTIRDNKGYISSKDLSTEFLSIQYPISVSYSGDGKDVVVAPPNGNYEENTLIPLSCSYDNISRVFEGWYQDNILESTTSSYNPMVTKPASYEARVNLRNFNVKVNKGRGSGVYKWGTSANISWNSNTHKVFHYWKLGAVKISTRPQFNHLIERDAIFTPFCTGTTINLQSYDIVNNIYCNQVYKIDLKDIMGSLSYEVVISYISGKVSARGQRKLRQRATETLVFSAPYNSKILSAGGQMHFIEDLDVISLRIK